VLAFGFFSGDVAKQSFHVVFKTSHRLEAGLQHYESREWKTCASHFGATRIGVPRDLDSLEIFPAFGTPQRQNVVSVLWTFEQNPAC
jgi:hypothetical protein